MAKFQPGQSGNPAGRPKKGTALADLLATALKAKGDDGIPKRKAVIDTLIKLALAGDLDAIKVILDRVDGKVVERLEHSGPDGGAIPIREMIVMLPGEAEPE